jgi:hypothetical protein
MEKGVKKEMDYPKNIVSKVRQYIEETNRRRMNPTSVWNQWEQFNQWDQGSEWIEVNAAPQPRRKSNT